MGTVETLEDDIDGVCGAQALYVNADIGLPVRARTGSGTAAGDSLYCPLVAP